MIRSESLHSVRMEIDLPIKHMTIVVASLGSLHLLQCNCCYNEYSFQAVFSIRVCSSGKSDWGEFTIRTLYWLRCSGGCHESTLHSCNKSQELLLKKVRLQKQLLNFALAVSCLLLLQENIQSLQKKGTLSWKLYLNCIEDTHFGFRILDFSCHDETLMHCIQSVKPEQVPKHNWTRESQSEQWYAEHCMGLCVIAETTIKMWRNSLVCSHFCDFQICMLLRSLRVMFLCSSAPVPQKRSLIHFRFMFSFIAANPHTHPVQSNFQAKSFIKRFCTLHMCHKVHWYSHGVNPDGRRYLFQHLAIWKVFTVHIASASDKMSKMSLRLLLQNFDESLCEMGFTVAEAVVTISSSFYSFHQSSDLCDKDFGTKDHRSSRCCTVLKW